MESGRPRCRGGQGRVTVRLPMLPVDAARDRQRRMWDETPLAGQTIYVVFWRKRIRASRSIRKYVSAARRGFTEDRFKAWKTTSLDEATRVAGNIEGGRVAEFKP